MEGLRIKPLWMLLFIFIANFSSLIFTKEVPSKEVPSKVLPSKVDECAVWNGVGYCRYSWETMLYSSSKPEPTREGNGEK